jgi:deazaflavin-dependent oxidoreductase (nitroreductase family)
VSGIREHNRRVIEEFRARGGRVGGALAGRALLLLTTTGARTGRKRTTPVMYVRDGARLLVFASSAGAPRHPDWYHNLVARPEVTVEMGTESYTAVAFVTAGEERDRLFSRAAQDHPFLAEYQAKTTRQIPVIALERCLGS